MQLFEECEPAGLPLRNRGVFRAVRTGFADDGVPTAALASHIGARAEGGAGLVIGPAEMLVHPSASGPSYVDAYDESSIEGLERVASAVHDAGGRIVGQLTHPGAEEDGDWGMQPQIAPAQVASTASYEFPRAATHDELAAIRAGFADAARNLERAGYDGVELSAGPNSILRQFLSPKYNVRDDEYGGDWSARAKFVNETLAAVSDAVAGPVGLSLSLAELEYGGYDFDDLPALLDALTGFAFLSVTLGTGATFDRTHAGPSVDAPRLRPHVGTVLDAVDVPVVGRESFTSREVAADLLSDGVTLVSFTRSLLADAHALAAWETDGRVTRCIECNQKCLEGVYGHAHGGHVQCVVNPRTGREADLPPLSDLDPAPLARRVLVVGGGPAGLHFATVAARRGHDVTLREASGELGGQLSLSAQGPLEPFEKAIEDLVTAVRAVDVTVELDARVTADAVELDWDAIVVATGATFPDASATYDGPVVDAETVLADGAEPAADLSGRVLLSDENRWVVTHQTGLTLAETAADLEIVTRDHYPGFRTEQPNLPGFVAALQARGVTFTGNHALESVADDGTATLRDTLTGDLTRRDPDAVVVAGRRSADESLYLALADELDAVHRIGDAVSPRSLDRAYYDAERLARRL